MKHFQKDTQNQGDELVIVESIENLFNDTHMEELVLYWKVHWNTRLPASDVFICLHNQLSSFKFIIVQMSEKRDSSSI